MTEPIAVDLPAKPAAPRSASLPATLAGAAATAAAAAILPVPVPLPAVLPKIDSPPKSSEPTKASEPTKPATGATPSAATPPATAPTSAPHTVAKLLARFSKRQLTIGASAVLSLIAGIGTVRLMFPSKAEPPPAAPAANWTEPTAARTNAPPATTPPAPALPKPPALVVEHPTSGGTLPPINVPVAPVPVAPVMPTYVAPAAPPVGARPTNITPVGGAHPPAVPPTPGYVQPTYVDTRPAVPVPPPNFELPAIPAAPTVLPAGGSMVPPATGNPTLPLLPTVPATPPVSPVPVAPASPPLTPPSGMGAPGVPPVEPTPLIPVTPAVPTPMAPAVPPPVSLVPVGPASPGPVLPAIPTSPPTTPVTPAPSGMNVGLPPIPTGPVGPSPSAPAAPTVLPDPRMPGVLPAVEVQPNATPKPPPPSLDPVTPGTPVGFSKSNGSTDVKPIVATTAPKTDFDVDLHDPKRDDWYESISQEWYNDKRYAAALKAFNRNQPLQGGRLVEVPPIHVLKKRFLGQGVGATSTPPAGTSGTLPPSAGPDWSAAGGKSEPAVPPAGNARGVFIVPQGGMTMKTIARTKLGTEQRWGDIWDLNRQLDPSQVLPAGTELKLPSDAR